MYTKKSEKLKLTNIESTILYTNSRAQKINTKQFGIFEIYMEVFKFYCKRFRRRNKMEKEFILNKKLKNLERRGGLTQKNRLDLDTCNF